MRFNEAEIEAARRLRRGGLSWEPRAGHYVYDETGFCKQTSPFQEKVITEPHKMTLSQQSKAGCLIGTDYPSPIVEHSVAYKAARERMHAVRRKDEARSEAKRVVKKHGSRKRKTQKPKSAKTR